MASSNLAIPAAIVLSSVILASGIYFGLRAGHKPADPVQPVQRVEEPPPPVQVPAPPGPAGPTPEVVARGVENARRALEGSRGDIIARCWTPFAAAQAEPRQIRLTFNMSFSPQGEMTALGLSEDREAARPEVANCIRQLPLSFRVPAPGEVLLVEVPFVLP